MQLGVVMLIELVYCCGVQLLGDGVIYLYTVSGITPANSNALHGVRLNVGSSFYTIFSV